jgi:hypothetical protein
MPCAPTKMEAAGIKYNRVRDHVSHPYKATGVHILIFISLKCRIGNKEGCGTVWFGK